MDFLRCAHRLLANSAIFWAQCHLNIGDIVATSPGSSASIGFTTDNSVIRLDTDTSVMLQAGTLDGRSVAQVTLDNGTLWGRVLTSTGINFGAGGYIAGVRGTSIAVKYQSGMSANFFVPHSTHLNDAVTVRYLKDPTALPYTTGTGSIQHLYTFQDSLPNTL